MKSMRVLLALAMAGVSLVVAAPGQAAADPQNCTGFSSPKGECINDDVVVGGNTYSADWYLPDDGADALMVLQHGFARNCSHLRGTSRRIMEQDVMVLCLNADMTGGNPGLAAQLGDALTAGSLSPPNGDPLPSAYIVGGHSAGGHFATEVGERLDANGYPDLRGAILFDAVAAGDFSSNLQAISDGGTRKVVQIAARPSVTNLFNNSFGGLNGLPNGFVGIQLVWSGYFFGIPYGGSCHTDVEGENTDLLGTLGALCSPAAFQTEKLREFASVWARDMARGTTTSAYWCTNKFNTGTCGSKVTQLVGGWLPKSALIR